MDFFTVFAAVFSANLLLIVFVWGAYNYSRHERDGTAGSRASNAPLLAIVVPLLINALCVMIALDGVPTWLDTILQ